MTRHTFISNLSKATLALALCLSLPLASYSATTAVDQAKLQKGGVVVTDGAQKSGIPSASAQILIPKPPAYVWSQVQQPEHLMDNEKKVKSLKVISQNGKSKDLAYTVAMSRLLPTFQYTLRHQPTQPMTMSFWRVNGSFKDVRGSWVVTPTNDGKSSILTYNTSIDPGPMVPKGLMQSVIKSDLPNMMNNVKTAILTP